jgi:ferredoxin
MPTLKVDRGLCEGYANCVFQAEDVFDLGEDNVVMLLRTQVPDSDRVRIEEAVESCPVGALTLIDPA